MLQELARKVHASDTVAALGQHQREPAPSARHIEQFGSRRYGQRALNQVGFASGGLR
jgi:hypothetical protein